MLMIINRKRTILFQPNRRDRREFGILQIALWRRLATIHCVLRVLGRFPHLGVRGWRLRIFTRQRSLIACMILMFSFRQFGGLLCVTTNMPRFHFRLAVANDSCPRGRYAQEQYHYPGNCCPPDSWGENCFSFCRCLSHFLFPRLPLS